MSNLIMAGGALNSTHSLTPTGWPKNVCHHQESS